MAGRNDFNPAPGGRISAPVKLYDAAREYGFLAPGGDLPDIFCHVSALRRVGLDMLIEGATVTCETVQGERGPQVSRIVDHAGAAFLWRRVAGGKIAAYEPAPHCSKRSRLPRPAP